MTSLPPSADDPREPVRGLRDAAGRIWGRVSGDEHQRDVELARILDLFEEHVYAGEITADGRYVHHAAMSTVHNLIGGSMPDDAEVGRFWESRIAPADWAQYEAFNRRLLDGLDAEVTYRLHGVDGVTRILRDRARPRRMPDGSVLVEGIIS